MIGALWLAIKAWGLWGRLGRAAAALGAWAGRNPAWALCAVLAVASGLLWHEWSMRGDTIARLTADKANMMAAQEKAKQLAAEALHHQEAFSRTKANEADHAHQTELADAVAAADAYIASHRVRAADIANRAGGASASAPGGSAAIPAPVPADAVMVSGGDVQACTSAVTYAIAAHNWATTINDPAP